jgi:hypothetical protein
MHFQVILFRGVLSVLFIRLCLILPYKYSSILFFILHYYLVSIFIILGKNLDNTNNMLLLKTEELISSIQRTRLNQPHWKLDKR